MYSACTQTSLRHAALLGTVMTMRSRMVVWKLEGLEDPQSIQILWGEKVLSGTRLWLQKLEMNFSNLCKLSLQRALSLHGLQSLSTPTIDTLSSSLSTDLLMDNSMRLQDCIDGATKTCQAVTDELLAMVSMPPSPALIIGHGGPSGASHPLAHSQARSAHTRIGRRRSLVLYGPTRLGKTVWARRQGEHAYFCGLYSGAEALRACGRGGYNGPVDYAIFDDIQGGIKFFHGFKNWLGCQAQFQVKVLYKDPVLIDWGKPCIWISNEDPRLEMSHADIEWMEGNCDFEHVTSAIFHANTESH